MAVESVHELKPIYQEVAEAAGDPSAIKLALWARMFLIRRHEEVVESLNAEGLIRGSTHLYIGMEAGAVGAVSSLTAEDAFIGYYRSHGHALAIGMEPRRVIAEILGRAGGCCEGRGGTKHIMDVGKHYYGAYAIVGQQVPLAVGIGWTLKAKANAEGTPGGVIACFFGDGAANQGTTLEAMNLASVMGVPCLFICENNLYAVTTPTQSMVGGGSLANRARGFGMDAQEVDGMDVFAVRQAVREARAAAVAKRAPAFLELRTYRYRGHSVFNAGDAYRTRDEVAEWKQRDPIELLGNDLRSDPKLLGQIESKSAEIEAMLAQAAQWAKSQPPALLVTEVDLSAPASHLVGGVGKQA